MVLDREWEEEGDGEGQRGSGKQVCLTENKNKGEIFAIFRYRNDRENDSDIGFFICSKANARRTTNTGWPWRLYIRNIPRQ